MARKKKHAEHVNHERWLVSYADFITLLFAFFTTLYSISSVDQKKAGKLMYSMLTALNVEFFPTASGVSGYSPMNNPAVVPLEAVVAVASKKEHLTGGGRTKERLAALSGAGKHAVKKLAELPGGEPKTLEKLAQSMGVTLGAGAGEAGKGLGAGDKGKGKGPGDLGKGRGPGEKGKGAGDGGPGDGEPRPPAGSDGPLQKMAGLAADLESLQKDPTLKGRFQVRVDSRGILISLSEAGFFHSGSAELRPGGFKALDSIAAAVARQGCPDLLVEGHTDNVPIHSRRYGSNWDLSTSRATFVVAYFMSRKQFDPTHLSAVGRGEFQPIDDNSTSAGRSRNRRVDIVVRFPAAETAPSRPDPVAQHKAEAFATAARADDAERPADEHPPGDKHEEKHHE